METSKKLTNLQAVRDSSSRLVKNGIDDNSAQFVFMQRKNWTLTDWLNRMNDEITHDDLIQLRKDEAKLYNHVPVQYVLGYADFYSRIFKVSSDTLIPRPETEELVAKALSCGDEKLPMNVVDIGTGSGVIGITLALNRPQWKVWATDISLGALRVAQENAKDLNANVHFAMGDVLLPFMPPFRHDDDLEMFDMIISNPPYISEAELDDMDESVKKYEPENALFADDDGLAIYKRLAKQAPYVLKQNGVILLEIGFRQGLAVKEIFAKEFPTRKVEVLKDMAGLDRIVFVHPID